MRLENTYLILIVVWGICLPKLSIGQQDRYWFIGTDGIGIDFSQCEPSLVEGAHRGFEGSAAVSNSEGELLFYTNGDFVINSSHQLMQGGEISGVVFDPLFNDPPLLSSLTQIGVAQRPGTNEYYIVTSDLQAGNFADLVVHTINMDANAGQGAVTSSTLLSSAAMTEKFCTIPKTNGQGFWMITHQYNNNQFDVFEVDGDGFNAVPQSFSLGLPHSTSTNGLNARGEMKANLAGTQIALVQDLENGSLELFDFNPSTGVISNAQFIDNVAHGFGLSFSPNGHLLYLSTWSTTATINNELMQYNLLLPTSQIASSKVILSNQSVTQPFGSIKLAPNNQLYVARPNTSFVAGIPNPNVVGSGCGYAAQAISLGSNISGFGLNSIWEIEPWVSDSIPEYFFEISPTCDEVTIGVPFYENENFIWSTGQTSSSITVQAEGVYSVSITDATCTVNGEIFISIPSSPIIELESPIQICPGESYTFTLTDSYSSVLWSDGSSENSYSSSSNETLSVTVSNGECASTAYSLVQLIPVISMADLDTIITVCYGERFYFELEPTLTYSMSNADMETVTLPNLLAPQHYFVNLSNTCQSLQYELDIVEKNCSCEMYTPNAFTPNADGINDIFYPVFDCEIPFQMCIFNRWGECIFRSSSTGEKFWDGSIQGGEYYAPNDIYNWRIERQLQESNGAMAIETGFVMLIR